MSTKDATTSLAFEVVKTACSNCNLRELCLPIGLDADDLRKVDELVSNLRREVADRRHGVEREKALVLAVPRSLVRR